MLRLKKEVGMIKLEVIYHFYEAWDKVNKNGNQPVNAKIVPKLKAFFLQHFNDFYKYNNQKAFEVMDVLNGVNAITPNPSGMRASLVEKEYGFLQEKPLKKYSIRLQKRWHQKPLKTVYILKPKSGEIIKKDDEEFIAYKKAVNSQILIVNNLLLNIKKEKIKDIVNKKSKSVFA